MKKVGVSVKNLCLSDLMYGNVSFGYMADSEPLDFTRLKSDVCSNFVI